MQRLGEVLGDAGEDLIVEVALGRFRLHQLMVAYSAPVTLDAFADLVTPIMTFRLVTFQLDGNRFGLWVPGQAIIALVGDIFRVNCPAGGPGVVAAVEVYGGNV